MRHAYLTIVNDAIEATPLNGQASAMYGYVTATKYKYRITTDEELQAFVKRAGVDGFMCSSALDFPRDFTDDEAIVKLACAIRGNVYDAPTN